jgi:predicted PurR-regulated permease PerM
MTMSASAAASATHRGRVVFLSVSAAVAVAVVVVAREVLLPFIFALVIAYVFTPAVVWAERRRVPRVAAILLVYAVLLGSLGTFAHFALPRIAVELKTLRYELPELARTAKERWVPALARELRSLGLAPSSPQGEPHASEVIEPDPRPAPPRPALIARPLPDGAVAIEVGQGVALTATKTGYVLEAVRVREETFDPNRMVAEAMGKGFHYAQENTFEIYRVARDVVAGITRTVFVFFITLMLAAYVMMTRERILEFFESLVRPSSRPGFHGLLARIDRGLSGVVRGQLLICLVNGILSAIGFAMVGLKYWPVLALVAAVLSLIPIFGSIVSSVPAVAIGLTQGIGTATFVFVWIVGIHQLEANFLNPKIMGDAAKIHPFLVVFSLLVGEHYFHAAGALLAVPCLSILLNVFLHFREIVHRNDVELSKEPLRPSFMPPAR